MQPSPTPQIYLKVFLGLMVLLAITIAAAFAPMERLFPNSASQHWARRASIAIAMTIAIIKATLIIRYFMQVRYAPRITWVFSGAGFLWLAIMLTLTLSDFLTRNHPNDLNYRVEPLITQAPTKTSH